MLTAAANACTATAAGQASPYGANGVAAPNAIVPGGYSITCTLPATATANDCTISVLDQRDWGGCVDVNMLAAGAAAPPAPPPAPLVTNAGSYPFSASTMVDTSADTFTCCPISSGSLDVPAYAPLGAATFTGNLVGARAINCRTSDAITAPTTATHELSGPLTFSLVPGGGNRYVAQVPIGGAWAGQPFEISVENGALDFTNTGTAQPIICDGFSTAGGAPVSGGTDGTVGGTVGAVNGEAEGNSGTVIVVIIIVVIILCLCGVAVFCCRRNSRPLPPPKDYPGAPPPPPPSGMPPGWIEMSDPSSGRQYYFNQGTGEVRLH